MRRPFGAPDAQLALVLLPAVRGPAGPAAARTPAEVTAAYALDDFAEVLDQWTPRSGGHGGG